MFWRAIVVIFTVIGLMLAINEVFVLGYGGRFEFENAYIYALMSIFLSIAFIIYPAYKSQDRKKILVDVFMFLLLIAFSGYLAIVANDITHKLDHMSPLYMGSWPSCCV